MQRPLTSASITAPLVGPRVLLAGALAALAAAVFIVVWGPNHVGQLPALNAALNGTAGMLLVVGYVLIKLRRERAHAQVMLSAFVTSMIFLTSYLVYHAYHLHEIFSGPDNLRGVYYGVLLSHVVLAATVPFLAGGTIYLGLKDRRRAHNQLAWWTLPIWLYVSITGVLIYYVLYVLYPAAG